MTPVPSPSPSDFMSAQYITCPSVRLHEALSDRAFRAVLPNGHELVAFVRPRMMARLGLPSPGDVVDLEISVSDFSQGQIMAWRAAGAGEGAAG